jgi:hypothetical protein
VSVWESVQEFGAAVALGGLGLLVVWLRARVLR